MHAPDNLLLEDTSPEALGRFMHKLAGTARKVGLHYFRADFAVDQKTDQTLVTVADRETEEKLCALIHERFPDHGIIGEELGSVGRESPCVWVIDPIDGTHGFITGSPLFGTLVGLLVQGKPVAGLLEMPALAERWVGIVGMGTVSTAGLCRTSTKRRLSEASVFATTPYMFSSTEYPRFNALSRRAKITRFGVDCYSYGLLASGFADLVVEADMMSHDYIGLIAVVEGAGGVMTDWNGNCLKLESDGRVLAAANPELHQEALAILSD